MPHSAIPVTTAFEQSPDRGKELAGDMPVRRALEEVGQPYDVRLTSLGANLAGYVARGEARPAFKRAFAAQLAMFSNKQST